MTENIIESTLDDAKKRLFESPFWSSFIISWLLMNWKIVYVTFSWSSTAIDDKIKYIDGLHQGYLVTILMVFIYPLLASFIAVALIPFINHIYLRLRKFHRNRDANIEIQEIQKEKEVIKEKQDLKKEEQELQKSEQEIWNDEYQKLIVKFPEFWSVLTNLIYESNGLRWDTTNGGLKMYAAGEIQLLDVNNLIELMDHERGTYTLTEKGKYFLQKHSLES